MPKVNLSDFIIITAQDDEVATAFAKALERKVNEAPKKNDNQTQKDFVNLKCIGRRGRGGHAITEQDTKHPDAYEALVDGYWICADCAPAKKEAK